MFIGKGISQNPLSNFYYIILLKILALIAHNRYFKKRIFNFNLTGRF